MERAGKEQKVFIPLRVHSVYSKGKGAATLEELALWVSQRKLPSAALTDIENLYGWGKWKRVAAERGFSPLFGCEIEIQGKRFLFLVKSREGYWHLMEILNQREIKETKGLGIVLIPQPGGEPLQALEFIPEEDFYLGGDFFNFKQAFAETKKHHLPLVWAYPLKFVNNPERLILLHSIQKKIPFPPERERLRQKVKLFGSAQETLALKRFGSEVKEVFKRTFEVAEKCSFSFEGIVPPLPEDLFPLTLREVVRRKLRNARSLSWRERERAKRELEVVESSGFAPYCLIVHDVVEFARLSGILHNLKGSGTSSFLAYLLGISHIDPIDFDLYFDILLNKGRD